MDFEPLIQMDKQLLLMLNGSDSVWLDNVVMTLTNARTWIPLYVALFYVVVSATRSARETLLIVAAAGLCVLLAGTVDDEIVKPIVARWRPTHDPQIGSLIDTVNGYRGGNYGFFSAHASNTFSLAVFFALLLRNRMFTFFIVGWSLVNCWTRMYLGVHFPGDIAVGLLWGGLVGWSVSRLYRRVAQPLEFSQRLCDVPVCVLCLTVAYAMLRSALL